MDLRPQVLSKLGCSFGAPEIAVVCFSGSEFLENCKKRRRVLNSPYAKSACFINSPERWKHALELLGKGTPAAQKLAVISPLPTYTCKKKSNPEKVLRSKNPNGDWLIPFDSIRQAGAAAARLRLEGGVDTDPTRPRCSAWCVERGNNDTFVCVLFVPLHRLSDGTRNPNNNINATK